jgi:hypothetical protein
MRLWLSAPNCSLHTFFETHRGPYVGLYFIFVLVADAVKAMVRRNPF